MSHNKACGERAHSNPMQRNATGKKQATAKSLPPSLPTYLPTYLRLEPHRLRLALPLQNVLLLPRLRLVLRLDQLALRLVPQLDLHALCRTKSPESS